MKDLRGRRCGLLVVVAPTEQKKWGMRVWLCRCDCGNTKAVPSGSLRPDKEGGTKSCGCANGRQPVHGMTGTPIHTRWWGMMQRCYQPSNDSYKKYGAKGITVCDRWHDFTLFYQDMGEAPANHELDRRDPLQGYSPENCQWLHKNEHRRKTWADTKASNLLTSLKGAV